MKKRVIKYACVLVFVLAVLLLVRKHFTGVLQDDYNNQETEAIEINIAENKAEQHIFISEQPISLNFLVKNSGSGSEEIMLELWDKNGEHCFKSERLQVPATSGEKVNLEWNISDVNLSDADEILVKIMGDQSSQGILLYAQEDDTGQLFLKNGVASRQHLRMTVVYRFIKYWGFLFLMGAVLLVIGAVCLYAWETHVAAEKLFAVIALAVGIALAFITPLGQEPDGWTHFARAMDVSYGNVLLPFWDNTESAFDGRAPQNMEEINFHVLESGTQAGLPYTKHLMEMKFSKETATIDGDNRYPSLFYMPQAIGTLLGRLLNLSVYACMVLGRLFNLACYTAITFFAIKKIPFYKSLLTAIALLPMSLFQAASYSTDALLNSLCFLFAALCFYYAFGEKEQLNWKDALALGVILAVIFCNKYVYVCLGLLVFLIPKSKFKDRKTYWRMFGIALVPLLIVMLLLGLKMTMGMSGASARPLLETEGQMSQLAYVKEHPKALVNAIRYTISNHFELYVRWLNVLGWLNYPLGILQIVIPCFLTAVACLDTQGINGKIKASHRMLGFAAGVIAIIACMTALYLADSVNNPVGSGAVMGFQGRYAIPCLLVMLAAFGSPRIENKIKGFSVKTAGCMGLFAAYAVYTLIKLCY